MKKLESFHKYASGYDIGWSEGKFETEKTSGKSGGLPQGQEKALLAWAAGSLREPEGVGVGVGSSGPIFYPY